MRHENEFVAIVAAIIISGTNIPAEGGVAKAIALIKAVEDALPKDEGDRD